MAALTRKDTDHFEQRLKQRREELRWSIHDALVRTEREDLSEIAGRVRDAGEESVADSVATMNLTVLDREVDELRDVEAALQRIRDGLYGQCQDCSGEIGLDRLEAYPTAKRCVECQRRHEVGRFGGRDQTPSL
jgi:RNA polymerase-binding protein DksA